MGKVYFGGQYLQIFARFLFLQLKLSGVARGIDRQAVTILTACRGDITDHCCPSDIIACGSQLAGIEVEVFAVANFAKPIGLISGDVILRIRGQKIGGVEDFKEVVTSMKPGEIIPIKVQRQRRALYLSWKVPALP